MIYNNPIIPHVISFATFLSTNTITGRTIPTLTQWITQMFIFHQKLCVCKCIPREEECKRYDDQFHEIVIHYYLSVSEMGIGLQNKIECNKSVKKCASLCFVSCCCFCFCFDMTIFCVVLKCEMLPGHMSNDYTEQNEPRRVRGCSNLRVEMILCDFY